MFRFFRSLVDPYADYAENDHPSPRLSAFLIEHARPFRKVLLLAGVLSVTVAGVEVLMLSIMGWIVDALAAGPEGFWQTHGWTLVALAVFVLVLRPLFQSMSTLVFNNAVMPNYETIIRWRAHRHVLRQSVSWFENDFAGRIANRIMQTPPAAGEALFQIFDAIAYSVAYVIGALWLLNGADPWLALPLVLWLLAYAVLMRWTISRVGAASQAASDARSEVTGRVVDAYSNIHSVKMFAHHERELEYGREAIEKARATLAEEMRIFTVMDIVLVLLNGGLIVGVVGWAIYLWSLGETTTGAVAAAAALTLRLNAMTGWIMWALTTFFRELGVVAEGMETIAQPIALVDAPKAKALDFQSGRIEIQGLSHHYGQDKGGLDGIDLDIAPGEKIGLVGRSGAGKSTLVKLLLRFYDVDQGRILLDGQDIAGVTQDSLRLSIGMVQQDSSLLHRSVRDNILYGRPDASDAEMFEAAHKAQAHEFILTLEDPKGRRGYDAHVGERGVKLSGGQRQRITLARAILKDAPILLLDEATSALDSEVEAIIQDTLYGMMEGKTVIAIAHRLSTIAKMDRILVMDQGRIVEQGSHDALLAQGGLYASFWARQSGGFLTTDSEATE